ncbi:hypothetical protein NHP194004_11090 [Helicobacter suis]|nr:hypothetical protein NHP194004_11090 [Helicobacter suis]
MQKIGYSSSPIAYEHEGMRLEGGVKRISSNLFLLEGHLQGRIQVECARSAKPFFKTLRQKSHSSLAGGMNATNLWYNAPIHSYLRQEVSEVTPLEI